MRRPRVKTGTLAVLAFVVLGLGNVGIRSDVSSAASSTFVAPSFFGLHAGFKDGSILAPPWPARAMRLHGAGTPWCRLNPAPNYYDWAPLDAWFAQAQSQQADLTYTFSRVPLWASSQGGGSTESCSTGHPAEIAYPDEAAWQSFVTALVQHSVGRIQFYELWNEPDGFFWSGTVDQMIRLSDLAAKIIRANDPGAKILSPGVTTGGSEWLRQYLSGIPRGDIDYVAFHGYPAPADGPEGIIAVTSRMRQAMAATNYTGYPTWVTEGSWGLDSRYSNYSDPKFQRGYVARWELVNLSAGNQRAYWYRYDSQPGSGWGSLWGPDTGLTQAGVAMSWVINWMSGATMTTPCSRAWAGLWTCNLTRPGGYIARVLWRESGSANYRVPPQYRTIRTLDGQTRSRGAVVKIDTEPILMENQPPA